MLFQLNADLFVRVSFFLFVDIDECLADGNLCVNGQCTNIEGSYECQCEIGYIPAEDKKSCVGKPAGAFTFYPLRSNV